MGRQKEFPEATQYLTQARMWCINSLLGTTLTSKKVEGSFCIDFKIGSSKMPEPGTARY